MMWSGSFIENATLGREVVKNIKSALDEVNASLVSIVRTSISLTDLDDWEAIGDTYDDVFGAGRPAASMIELTYLTDSELLVEIEAIAVISDQLCYSV
jgi:Putative translation initiation inhibitor, yjgF family